jgi:transposase
MAWVERPSGLGRFAVVRLASKPGEFIRSTQVQPCGQNFRIRAATAAPSRDSCQHQTKLKLPIGGRFGRQSISQNALLIGQREEGETGRRVVLRFSLDRREPPSNIVCMAAYSIDLRQKILRACERRLGSQRTIVDVFGVSLAFVEKISRQYRATGDIAPKPHRGGQKPRLDGAAQAAVQRLVEDHPDATLEGLCTGVAGETGLRVSVPAMCRVLQRLRLPRKKSRSMRRSAIRRGSSRHARTITGGARGSTPDA